MGWFQKLKACYCAGGLDKNVWTYEPGLPGVLWQAWLAADAAPHGPTGDIFNVPGAGPWGLNGHVNGAPTQSGTHPTFSFTDFQLVGNAAANQGTDQFTAHGFLKIPEGGGFIREQNPQTGEMGRVFLGQKDGCCNARMQLVVDRDTDTVPGDAGLIATPIAVDGGECPAYFELSDLSVFSGGRFQFSPTIDGTYVDLEACQTRGKWVCRREPCGYVLKEGESFHGPAPCCPDPYIEATASGETQTITCADFCPVVVGELENVDGPLDLNPLQPTAISWGGFQSQDNSVVEVDGDQATIASTDVCAAHITASVTFINEDGTFTGNAQRAHPETWLLRNGTRVALAQVYLRDANGQDSDTATISWYDRDPAVGTTYSLEVERDSIETDTNGQAGGSLEAFRSPETANYLQVAAHRRFSLCSVAKQSALYEDYLIRSWNDNGFFNTTQMNGQIQVFNVTAVPGASDWELRFDANYDITGITPSAGFSAGAIQKVDNGTTFSYVIPMSGAIPGNSGNAQIAITGVRKAGIADTTATHSNQGVYV